MTHLHTTKARKAFVITKLRRATPKQTTKIYLCTEKAIGYKHKKTNKRRSWTKKRY